MAFWRGFFLGTALTSVVARFWIAVGVATALLLLEVFVKPPYGGALSRRP